MAILGNTGLIHSVPTAFIINECSGYGMDLAWITRMANANPCTRWVVGWCALFCSFHRYSTVILRLLIGWKLLHFRQIWAFQSIPFFCYISLSREGVPTWLKYCWLRLVALSQSINIREISFNAPILIILWYIRFGKPYNGSTVPMT